MSNCIARYLANGSVFLLACFSVSLSAQETSLISGQNINMVSGMEWPTGDPFLQRQNEPTIAVSTRNEFHLMGGSNDYRTVDLPGLPEGKTTGDSWISAYFSNDGGGRWTSTLLPGYPQDTSPLGLDSPLRQAGYEASADPVIRTGTHGLFYYSGIAFTRGDEPPSAGFVATYVDLNNDERGNTIGYVGTTIFDQNDDGSSFIDKPWIAVDKPRAGAAFRTLDVNTDNGVVPQTVECGNLYAAYARIQGEDSAAVSSQIMFTRSEDCGLSFSDPVQLTLPDTINQGAAIAVDPTTGRIQVAWRQFSDATMNCVREEGFWLADGDAWPVNGIELAGFTYESDNTDTLFPGPGVTNGPPWLVLRQLVSAWLNVLSGADNSEVAATLAEAEAWLLEYPPGSNPRGGDRKKGYNLRKALRNFNRGNSGTMSCDGLIGAGMLSGMNPNAIMLVSSTDAGESFSDPIAISGDNYFPFEQGTTEFSFRSTGYPTMVFDGDGRSYVAFTTRGLAIPDFDELGGDGRIVVTTSSNGTDWSFPLPIDEPERAGHQLMPALEFSRGKVFLLYYDFREDVSGVFDRFVTDLPVDSTTPRHSVDVRAAQADAADVPIFTDNSVLDQTSTQTSRYPFLILSDENGDPNSQQMQYNPPNLPMFKGGLVPFFGDFIDLAALHFVTDDLGNWQFNTDPARGAPVVHAVWTDNRDVVAPLDGDWTSYVPPGDGTPRDSIFSPGESVPVCSVAADPTVIERTKMRNQNVYTSRLTQGLAVAVPGNNRPLGIIQRVFVGFVQNLTDQDKLFRLEILNQPVGGSASFDQFGPQTIFDAVVERNSSISRSIYVSSTDPAASIDISVVEVDVAGNPIIDGLSALTKINPDPSAPAPDTGNILTEEIYTPAIFNPAIFNPAVFNPALLGTDEVGIFNPAIFNPAIFNNPEDAELVSAALKQLALLNPAIFNPAIFNPAIFNPAIFNPAIFNPAIFNPAIFNPAIFNPAIFNPSTANPAIFNPAIFNPAIFNSTLVETTVVIENNGNATAAYSLNLDLEDPPEGFLYQTMIYKTYLVPSVDGCELVEMVEQEQLVNELTPDVNGSLLDPDSTSFFIAPGDNVVATLRIVPDPNAAVPGDPTTIDILAELNLSQSVVPQAVDTPSLENGETEPKPVSILAPSLPLLVIDAVGLADGTVGESYSETLGTTGGSGTPVSWSLTLDSELPPGLSLTSGGDIVGTPVVDGVFFFGVRAADDDQIAEQGFSITVNAGLPTLPFVSEDSAFGIGTITRDPATLRRWLDVTLSTAFSYNEMLVQLANPGGPFDGYRLANNPEVITFWQNAGIDTGTGSFGVFTPENFQPIVDLMAFVGVTGPNAGNLGGGNFFDFTVGHIESFIDGSGFVTVASLGADPDPTVTGRASFAGVPIDNSNNQHGSWLLSGPFISNVSLITSAFEIDGPPVSQTTTIDNRTGLAATGGTLQVWIDQGSTSRFAGSMTLSCGGAAGELPAGSTCNQIFTLDANNGNPGTGTLVAGPATLRFDLVAGSVRHHFLNVPIDLDVSGILTTSWRADFDLSSASPPGPYVCVRNQFQFNVLNDGQIMVISIFDADTGGLIGGPRVITGIGANNVGFETFLSGSMLVNGRGFYLVDFSEPTELQSLQLEGRTDVCIGGGATGFFGTELTPDP